AAIFVDESYHNTVTRRLEQRRAAQQSRNGTQLGAAEHESYACTEGSSLSKLHALYFPPRAPRRRKHHHTHIRVADSECSPSSPDASASEDGREDIASEDGQEDIATLVMGASSKRLWLLGLYRGSAEIQRQRSIQLQTDEKSGHRPSGLSSPEYFWTKLHELLVWSSLSRCSDPRDHIYAVLGISNPPVVRTEITPETFIVLTVDYNKTTAEVFTEVTRYLIWLDGIQNVLGNLTAVYGGSIDGHVLPSWCVNWNRPLSYSDYGAYCFYNFDSQAQESDRRAFEDRSRTLSISGFRVGTVKTSCARCPHHTGLIQDGDIIVWRFYLGTEYDKSSRNSRYEDHDFEVKSRRALIVRSRLNSSMFAFVGWTKFAKSDLKRQSGWIERDIWDPLTTFEAPETFGLV
ncbi:hypothetical protein LTR81_000497, partial [Elasticomyces elasticus]